MLPKFRFGLLLVIIVLFFGGNLVPQALTAQEILTLVNQDRSQHGLNTLSLNSTLNLAAYDKAEDMVLKNYFGHEGPDGTNPWYWLKTLGYNYTYAGENLARGYSDPHDLENSWMASPTHRANILSPFYSEVGLAVVSDYDTNIIVQFFGSKGSRVTLRQ